MTLKMTMPPKKNEVRISVQIPRLTRSTPNVSSALSNLLITHLPVDIVSQIQNKSSAAPTRTYPEAQESKSRGSSRGVRGGFRGNFRGGFKGSRKASSGANKNKASGGVAKKKSATNRYSDNGFNGASARHGGGTGGFGGGGIGMMPT